MSKVALSVIAVLVSAASLHAVIRAPYSLGQMCNESANVVLLEVVRINQDKNLIFFKKVADLKGKSPGDEVKQDIGKRADPNEWQAIMSWAKAGKKAIVFQNGNVSVTAIDAYWYRAHRHGEWWGMAHAEPYLLRTYYGPAPKLAADLGGILKGNEVVIPCLTDGSKQDLQERKCRLQYLKASLKLSKYDAKRDFVRFGEGNDADR